MVLRVSSGRIVRTSYQALPARAVSARHLFPGDVFVDAGLAGEAEDALAEDVAHDLGRAALDRVGPGPQEHVARFAERGGEADLLGAPERVVEADERVGAEQVHAQLVDALLVERERELGDRAFRPGVPRLRLRGGAQVGEAQHLFVDPELHEPVEHRGIVVGALVPEVDGLRDRTRRALRAAPRHRLRRS